MPLLTSVDCTQHVHLIVGDNGIAAKRATRSLEAGAMCIVISPTEVDELPFDLKGLLGREEVDRVVDMVFVTLSPVDKKGTISPCSQY